MLDATISRIAPLDEAAMQRCKVRLDNLTKPLNSLGAFEQLACQMAGVTGLSRPKMPQSSIVLAADGTIEPGALPRIFAAHVGAELVSFDAGQGRGRSRTGMVAAMEAGILAARIEAAKGSKILGLGTLGESASGDAARIFCSEEFIQEPVAALVAAGSPEIAGLCGVILGAAAEPSWFWTICRLWRRLWLRSVWRLWPGVISSVRIFQLNRAAPWRSGF